MTPTQPLILLVGATGQIGSLVTRSLVDRGAHVRALARDVPAATARLGPAVEVVPGDLLDPPSLASALRGVEVAYLTTAPGPQLAEQEGNFIDQAQAVELPRLVKLSAVGSRLSTEPPFGWHAASETRLEKSGIPATVLRCVPFTSILLWGAPTVKAGTLNSIMGEARFSFIDPQDVADLAVAALTDDSYAGRSWDVGGPEALTYDQVAATFTRVLARPVEHVGVDEATFRAGLRAAGLPDWLGDVLVASATLARLGTFDLGDAVIHRVLGRPGGSVASWIGRNVNAFNGEG